MPIGSSPFAECTVGFGAHKRHHAVPETREARIVRRREMLARVLNLGTTVAFVGNGCSVPLGYPRWGGFVDELMRRTVEALRALAPDPTVRADIGCLERLHLDLGRAGERPTELLMYALGACRDVCRRHDRTQEVWLELLKERFGRPAAGAPCDWNPHDALMKLKIRRFVTTNYDDELCRAINRVEGRTATSFNQTDRDSLALFCLARVKDANDLVFHCHGRYDEPDTIVASESDYQHWYLGPAAGSGVAFRQTLRLLLTSNPILFVGYGLGEEDLLRPLRWLSAIAGERKGEAPLFALADEPSDGAHETRHEALYERYGLKVIPYTVSPEEPPEVWGRRLGEALARLEADRQAWRRGWIAKPAMRRISVAARPPAPYRHYGQITSRTKDLRRRDEQSGLNDLVDTVNETKGVVVVLGPGGTGKSWRAMRLVDRLQHEDNDFEGYFFWSSYYADDALSGLDRAIAYLDPDGTTTGSRFERFRACLGRGRYLLVFDGFERLLRQGEQPEEGEHYSWAVGEFLEAAASPDHESTILLTTRLRPRRLGPDEPGRVAVHRVTRLQSAEIADQRPYRLLGRSRVSELCALLEGHTLALTLAAYVIDASEGPDFDSAMDGMFGDLAETPPDRRTSNMIEQTIRVIDRSRGGMAKALLERLAVFMGPINAEALRICFELAADECGVEDGRRDSLRDGLVDDLVRSRLIHRIEPGPGERDHEAHAVHPIIRGYVFTRLHGTETDALPNFTLPGFTAGTEVVDPGSERGIDVVVSLFDRLCRAGEERVADGALSEARELCRGGFGVVRSRMSANTVVRWTSYGAYVEHVFRLGTLAKSSSSRLWHFADRLDDDLHSDRDGVLYPDELAWLYNEIGAVCYHEGELLDSLAAWQQAHAINGVVDSMPEGGMYLFQSACNLGAAYVHLGRLGIAEQYLQQAEQIGRVVEDEDHVGRIVGYRGVIAHLRGNFDEARRAYRVCLRALRAAGGNPRAESVFRRHYADLLIVLRRPEKARRHIESSAAIAESAKYPDLVLYARGSMGDWFRHNGDLRLAVSEYTEALEECRRKGIRRLECSLLTKLARLALRLGDAENARQRALEALSLANELVLGLRQTTALSILGRAALRAGQRDLGIAYLHYAIRLADRQEYWLRRNEIQADLHRWGGVEWLKKKRDRPVLGGSAAPG